MELPRDILDVRDVRDILDVRGVSSPRDGGGAPEPAGAAPQPRPFLMIWFRCCATYARLQRSVDGSRYLGNCPKCRARLEVPVGEGGTSRRMFEAS